MPTWKSALLTPPLCVPISMPQARQKNGGDQVIGRSRGGLTTKVHSGFFGLS